MKSHGAPELQRRVGARLGVFQRFARLVVQRIGHPMAFGLALGIIFIWLLPGPFFHFNYARLLVIDTVGNLITFLMIFLIQNAQNRESEAAGAGRHCVFQAKLIYELDSIRHHRPRGL